jgi:hypothetical protein
MNMKLWYIVAMMISLLLAYSCTEEVDGLIGPPDDGNGNGNGEVSVIGIWDYTFVQTALTTGASCKDTTYTQEVEIEEEPWDETPDTNCTTTWDDHEFHSECEYEFVLGQCTILMNVVSDGQFTKDSISMESETTVEFSETGCELYEDYYCKHFKTEVTGVRKD